jgi:hypothetical protein
VRASSSSQFGNRVLASVDVSFGMAMAPFVRAQGPWVRGHPKGVTAFRIFPHLLKAPPGGQAQLCQLDPTRTAAVFMRRFLALDQRPEPIPEAEERAGRYERPLPESRGHAEQAITPALQRWFWQHPQFSIRGRRVVRAGAGMLEVLGSARAGCSI